MMKKEWKKPALEILDVNMTMAHIKMMNATDKTFEAGTQVKDMTWS